MTKKLKPCPFCGEYEDIGIYYYHDSQGKYVKVECHNAFCLCSTDKYETKEEAIKAWNKRQNHAVSIIKDCPFCGGEARLIYNEEKLCYIECTKCHANTTASSDYAVSQINTWNRRS